MQLILSPSLGAVQVGIVQGGIAQGGISKPDDRLSSFYSLYQVYFQ